MQLVLFRMIISNLVLHDLVFNMVLSAITCTRYSDIENFIDFKKSSYKKHRTFYKRVTDQDNLKKLFKRDVYQTDETLLIIQRYCK